MTNFARFAAVGAAVAGLVLAATPAAAAPAGAATPAKANARIIKPLSLTATGVLNFGTIVMNGVSANRTIKLSDANVLDCAGGSTEVVCDATTTTVPTYTVKGTQGQTVTVTKTASPLTGSNGGTLSLLPTGPASVFLANSGTVGSTFAIGGEITIAADTLDGVYSGDINVTVDY
ncbi:DUF4402 domain-containing protein [Sphingomonas sp. GCM10030256]|uniref:DUF4402 domain-containing protein n=1 Tax=Sphingomonas sp. GCM10030256 TaxID=3273427 RepID=UPI00361D9C8F